MKEAAIDFLRLCSSGKSREAFCAYAAPDFVHHNPSFPRIFLDRAKCIMLAPS